MIVGPSLSMSIFTLGTLEKISADEKLKPAGHIVTGNLKIITDSRIRSVISKGPKYRFPAHHIDFNKCRETIASALNDYCTR